MDLITAISYLQSLVLDRRYVEAPDWFKTLYLAVIVHEKILGEIDNYWICSGSLLFQCTDMSFIDKPFFCRLYTAFIKYLHKLLITTLGNHVCGGSKIAWAVTLIGYCSYTTKFHISHFVSPSRKKNHWLFVISWMGERFHKSETVF